MKITNIGDLRQAIAALRSPAACGESLSALAAFNQKTLLSPEMLTFLVSSMQLRHAWWLAARLDLALPGIIAAAQRSLRVEAWYDLANAKKEKASGLIAIANAPELNLESALTHSEGRVFKFLKEAKEGDSFSVRILACIETALSVAILALDRGGSHVQTMEVEMQREYLREVSSKAIQILETSGYRKG